MPAHVAHDHGHEHSHSHIPARGLQKRALTFALVANGGFLFVEAAGGVAFHSLALLADAAHMLSDVAALTIALIAHRLIDRPATTKHSYGLQRAEVLGAQVNGVVLVAVAGLITFEAIQRFGDPGDVDGGPLLIVATLGLLVNIVSAVFLARAQGRSLNMRAAYLHMVFDAAGSVAAMVAGFAIVVWGADWTDPVASIVISVFVVIGAWSLLRDAAQVLLEGTPRGMDPVAVSETLLADADVEEVHHLHLWNLASDVPALSAHVVLNGERTLHQAQESGDRLKLMLEERHGIGHVTLELECHPCEEPITY